MKKILILHSPLSENAPADELDVLQEAEFFAKALCVLGYDTAIIPFPYDVLQLKNLLEEHNPLMVVNLVETLMGSGKLVHIGPAWFEALQVPYTGCSAHALYLTSHKILSKQLMRANGIVTPYFFTYKDLVLADDVFFARPYLVKSLWEHASFGMDENMKLVFDSKEELLQRFSLEKHPDDFFCEEYIHGREFNLSMLGGDNGPEVLPVAEIRFSFPQDKPHILGYKAKWDEESFEYKNTIRTFDFPQKDSPLLEQLKIIALRCWEVFGLAAYARVDFRVDEQGKIYVLEINANPCISADSGFVAAAEKAGFTPEYIVLRILQDVQVQVLSQN